jgi:hypothetical protein
LISKVYSYENSKLENNPKGSVRSIFNGAGSILSSHSIKVITIEKGKKIPIPIIIRQNFL